MNRRSFLKQVIGSGVALIELGGGIYFDAREIEPIIISLYEQTKQSSKIQNGYQNSKNIQVTDTHISFHYTVEQLKELIKKINAELQDIILVTDDLVDSPQTYNWEGVLTQALPSL